MAMLVITRGYNCITYNLHLFSGEVSSSHLRGHPQDPHENSGYVAGVWTPLISTSAMNSSLTCLELALKWLTCETYRVSSDFWKVCKGSGYISYIDLITTSSMMVSKGNHLQTPEFRLATYYNLPRKERSSHGRKS